jgi:hypothetical protein
MELRSFRMKQIRRLAGQHINCSKITKTEKVLSLPSCVLDCQYEDLRGADLTNAIGY